MSNIATLKPFQKGHDPRRNIKGRLPSSEKKTFQHLLLKYLNKEVVVGKTKKTMLEVLAEKIIDDAVRGNIGAIKLVFDRIEGKVPTAAQIQGKTGGKPNGTLSTKELGRLEKIFSDLK